MDYSLSNRTVRAPQFPPSAALKNKSPGITELSRTVSFTRLSHPRPRSLSVTAGPSHCESSSSLNTPLEPQSAVGKYLSGVLQNQRQLFHVAVDEELKLLADDRDSAVARMVLSDGSDEACLHRRILELKEHDSKTTIEEIIYALILFKFSEIKVHLTPKLSSCIHEGRLELWPSRDYELESIHTHEVREMVKDHVHVVTGLAPVSRLSDLWATTLVRKWHLSNTYLASVLYGYFLKSASIRLRLDNHLVLCQTKLRCYVTGFDSETLQRCAKVRSRVGRELIEKQTVALFGERRDLTGKVECTVITASFSSLKRLVLEAVAFGSFLWDVEEAVDSVYSIRNN